MIRDPAVRAEALASWTGVRDAQARSELNRTVAFFMRAFPDPEVEKLIHSLLVILAFGVLEEVLLQLRDEGSVVSTRSQLAALMSSSVATLPWIDFERIDRARALRNQIAHESLRIDGAEATSILDAIEDQLVAWRVLNAKVRVAYRFESK